MKQRATLHKIATALAVAVLAWSICTHEADAAGLQTTADFQVSAVVALRCSFAVTSVSFGAGTYVSGSPTDVDAVGAFIVDCTKGANSDLRLGQGLYPGAGSTDANPVRRMGSGTNRLVYQLYEDSSYTTVWDNQPKGVKPGHIYPVTLSVYARIPAGQTVVPGDYKDTVVATIWF